jgi:WhiB family redox-sensing transcriptional regulator
MSAELIAGPGSVVPEPIDLPQVLYSGLPEAALLNDHGYDGNPLATLRVLGCYGIEFAGRETMLTSHEAAALSLLGRTRRLGAVSLATMREVGLIADDDTDTTGQAEMRRVMSGLAAKLVTHGQRPMVRRISATERVGYSLSPRLEIVDTGGRQDFGDSTTEAQVAIRHAARPTLIVPRTSGARLRAATADERAPARSPHPAGAAVSGVDWRHRAICRDEDPELFFPVGTSGPALLQIAEAKTVCRRCPVVSECLSWALDSGQDAGVWGGMSEDERRAPKRHNTWTRARTV